MSSVDLEEKRTNTNKFVKDGIRWVSRSWNEKRR